MYFISKEERDNSFLQDIIYKSEWLFDNTGHISLILLWCGIFIRVAVILLIVSLLMKFGFVLSLIITVITVVLLNELLAALIPSDLNSKFNKSLKPLIQYLLVLVLPFGYILSNVSKIFDSRYRLPGRIGNGSSNSKELSISVKEAINIAKREGFLDRQEIRLLDNIVNFMELDVKQIMTPRNKLIAVKSDIKFERLLYEIKKNPRTKIPVYDDELENIKGVIYLKELMPYFTKVKKGQSITSFIRTVHFVPENKLLIDLLYEFNKNKLNVAIVVNEYGGVDGLVTLTNLISRVIGKYVDENDRSGRLINKISDNKYVVDGSITLVDFANELNFEFERSDTETDTLAGYLIFKFNRFPSNDECYEEGDFKFTIKNVNEIKIEKVLVEKL